jgi:hypothetical protein
MIILLDKFLNSIQYTGEKVICHADLGEIEHCPDPGPLPAHRYGVPTGSSLTTVAPFAASNAR